MPQLSNRVNTFTDSVIRRMTRISDEYGAINLSQGFPDFDPPKAMLDALAKAAYAGPHQYSVTFGAENFREALAKKQGKAIGREIDPDKEIVVTCGGTEAMMCAMMTICNPGDKVMVFSRFMKIMGQMRSCQEQNQSTFHSFHRSMDLISAWWKKDLKAEQKQSSYATRPIRVEKYLQEKN